MRQSWNLRRYPRGRPHTLQRLTLRVMYFGFRAALTIIEVLAIDSFLSRLLAERHPELAKEETSLLVVLRVRDDGDVHSLRLVDLARVDLRENQMVANTQGVVAATVEGTRRDTAEVAHA